MARIDDQWRYKDGSAKPRAGLGHQWLAIPDGGLPRRKFRRKVEAQAYLTKLANEVATGVYVAPHSGSKQTLRKFAEQWIPAQLQLRETTAQTVRTRWNSRILPALGDVELGELTRPLIQAAVAEWNEELAAATVRVTYGYLAKAMRDAVADGLIPKSPCVDINLPTDDREPIVPLTVEQVHEIAANVPERFRAMVLLGAASGMRSGELRGLTLDRLSFGIRQLTVTVDRQLASVVAGAPVFGKLKTSTSRRTLLLSGEIVDVMRRHIARYPQHESGLVFTGRARGGDRELTALTHIAVWRAWDQGTAGMDDLRPRNGWHDLRHFYASALIFSGFAVPAVAARLGHKDQKMTLAAYSHLWPQQDDAMGGAVDALLFGSIAASDVAPVVQLRPKRL